MRNNRVWAVVVAIGWLIPLAVCIGYTAKYARNLPMQDEWEFIPVLVGKESSITWIFQTHNEHRYIFGRAVYLLLQTATGNWFPSGVVFSLVLLGVSAWLLCHASRISRGRFHPADIWFSVLLLNIGQFENLLMGYQLVFTLTTFFTCVLLWLMTTRPECLHGPKLVYPGVILIPIALGGGVGLAMAVPLSAWFATLVFLSRGEYRSKREYAPIVLILVAISAWIGWAVFDVLHRPATSDRNDFAKTVEIAAEFIAVGIGPIGDNPWPNLRWFICGVELISGVLLLFKAIRSPQERATALGLAAVLAAAWLVAFAVGHSRSLGSESRYTTISCLGLCATLLALSRYVVIPHFVDFVFTAISCVAWYFLQQGNYEIARHYGWTYQVRTSSLRQDIARRVPLDFVVDRNVFFPMNPYRNNFRLLSESGYPHLANIAPNRPMKSLRKPLPPETFIGSWDAIRCSEAPRYPIDVPTESHLYAVRLHYHTTYSCFWQPYKVTWRSKKDGEIRCSEVFLWVIPWNTTTSFWIDDDASDMRLEAEVPNEGLILDEIEFFTEPLR